MNAFEIPCPNCKTPGDDCPPLEGNCGHFFHLHCIYKWLETNDKCPLDRELWSVNKKFINKEKTISILNINQQAGSNLNIVIQNN
jgi:anaphase-promoting complex subunit 11